VAGIVASVFAGVPAVELMAVRAVPDGDERDKDVANAIRYAVDNGAHVINMSFGKGYSPQKAVVDEAVRYADERGVLLVHAAGNDGKDLADSPNFPSRSYLEGGEARNWITVGASSWRGADTLVAPFSNYGQAQVDLFAPGVDITSAVPGGGFEANSGTSMAAPLVAGVAALVMAYYPELTASQVRTVLLETATRHADRRVLRPGEPGGDDREGGGDGNDGAQGATSEDTVAFGTLSVTGGVVNAWAALRRAGELAAERR
jgi:subtilisin family serine protease